MNADEKRSLCHLLVDLCHSDRINDLVVDLDATLRVYAGGTFEPLRGPFIERQIMELDARWRYNR